MSAQSRDELVTALRAHVADEGDGAFLTDFVVLAAAAMPADPDSTTYIVASSDGPVHHRLGLVRYLAIRTDQLLTNEEEG